MKTSRFTESQIIAILKQAEAGTPVSDLCREHGMSNGSFYKWRSKYGGMDDALNPKRVYRVMKEHRLLLPKAPKRRLAAAPTRAVLPCWNRTRAGALTASRLHVRTARPSRASPTFIRGSRLMGILSRQPSARSCIERLRVGHLG